MRSPKKTLDHQLWASTLLWARVRTYRRLVGWDGRLVCEAGFRSQGVYTVQGFHAVLGWASGQDLYSVLGQASGQGR